MGKKIVSGSSVSLNNEVNMIGSSVITHSTKCNKWPLLTTPTPDNSSGFCAMLPALMGAVPVSSGGQSSCFAMAALGSVCTSAGINLSPNTNGSGFNVSYINVLQRMMNGASTSSGTLDEEKLKKLMMALISKMLENAGPGFSSWKQVLMNTMEKGTLQEFMKGVQSAVCALTGDPVNANTGNFVYEKEDLLIPGKMPLCFKRSFNRIDKRIGMLGRGWRHNYEIQLLIEEDRYVILWEDGREEVYFRNEDDTPEPLFGGLCLLKGKDGKYYYTSQNKTEYIFNGEGKLLKTQNKNGQGLCFVYDKKGRLSLVTNSYGSSLSYIYDDLSGRLAQVTDHADRNIKFTYELGRLKEVISATGSIYTYYYDTDNHIYRIRNPRGVYSLENSYDKQGRTVRQTFADGGEISYDYQEDLSRTLMTEQNGNKIAYVHDEGYRNVKTVYSDGEERFCYNNRNQMTSKVDKKGNKTKFSYDDSGNLTQLIYPDGSKHNMTYDLDNHLLVLSVNGVTKLKNTYDTKGNLIRTIDAAGRKRDIIYDENGNAVKVIQPDGGIVMLYYDRCGNVSRMIDEAGSTTAYEYDDCNRIIQTTDGNGNQTKFTYNSINQIRSVTNALGLKRTYTYTKNGKIEKVTDYNGAVIKQSYNNMDQVESVLLADGESFHMEYDLMQHIVKRILPNGAEVGYQYDQLGRQVQMRTPAGGVVHYEYDVIGNCTSIKDVNGNCIFMEYDELNRMLSSVDQTGARTSYSYDLDGNLAAVTNSEGKSHTYIYDEAGQLIAETDIAGRTTSYTYNELKQVTCITDPQKRKRHYEYGPGGQLLKTIYEDGSFETFVYDKNRNLTHRENQKGDYLNFTYDCLNRIISVSSNCGPQKSYTYDAIGNVVSICDANGNTIQYDYSVGGRLLSVLDAESNRTEYAYDVMGNLTAICQHAGDSVLLDKNGLLKNNVAAGGLLNNLSDRVKMTRYQRNMFGKVETIVDPLGFTEEYRYNLAGQVVFRKDKEGYETQYSYAPMGKLEKISYHDGRSVAFSYNSLRQLIEVQDWLGGTKIELDEAGRTKKITDYKGRETRYQWGMNGEPLSLVYPNGEKVSYEYDEFSRLNRLVDGDREILYHYNEEGRLSEKNYSDGVISRYEYNGMGLLEDLIHEKDGAVLERYAYEYDKVGNRTGLRKDRSVGTMSVPEGGGASIQEENGYYQYSYDGLNHLIEVKKDNRMIHQYKYDAFGNRIEYNTQSQRIRGYFNQSNQLIRTEGGLSEEFYKYDARGNLISIFEGEREVNRYSYDVTNRLAESINKEGMAATYQYDGLGNRVGLQEYAVQTKEHGIPVNPEFPENPTRGIDYLIDLSKQFNNLLEKTEYNKDGIYSQRYTWDSNAAFMTEGESAHIYLQDELGSTVRLLGIQKNEQRVYGYDEFGNDIYGNQGELQPFGFTGYQKDTIAHTYYAQAREYLPKAGIFGGEDSVKGRMITPKTFNLYSYCVQNPLKWIDSQGKAPGVPSPCAAVEWAWEQERKKAAEAFDYLVSGEYFKDLIIPEPKTYTISVGEMSTSDYIGAMYLLNEGHGPGPNKGWNLGGAMGQGHAALLLIKEDGMGEFYSYAGDVTAGAVAPGVGSNGYLSTYVEKGRISEISVNDFFNSEGAYTDLYSHPGRVGDSRDSYSHGVYVPITNEEGQAMHAKALAIRQNPGLYNLWSHNCNMVAQIILDAGGKSFALSDFDWWGTRPDTVYNEIVKAIKNGDNPGWLYGELNQFHYINNKITNCP